MSMRTIPIYEDDQELKTICLCVTHLSKLGWDGQWRVLNYLLIRYLGRSWALAKPKSDT